MSSFTPSRTIRRRADFSDLFRGQSSCTSSSLKKEVQTLQSTEPPKAPDAVVPVQPSSTTLKRVATKIPFLGRGRKKSTPSVKSGYMSAETSHGYESSDIDTVVKKNRRFSQPLVPVPPRPPLPKPSAPKKPSSPQSRPSLSSKFAAHLSGKSRKVQSSNRSVKHIDGTVSDTVAVQRQPSVESNSTNGTQGRNTPRGRPTITISSSPGNLDEYKDLFTLPRRKGTSSGRRSITPASEYRDLHQDASSNGSSNPLTTSILRTNGITLETMSEIALREARQLAEGHVFNPHSKPKKPISLPNLAEADDSAMETIATAGSTPCIDITPAPSQLPRSRSRLRSSVASKERSLPPAIPLPRPPIDSPPKSPSLRSSPRQSSQSILTPTDPNASPRSRSNTLGSTAPSQKSSTRPASWASQRRCSNKQVADRDIAALLAILPDKDNIDINLMPMDQLKEVLKKRNDQYEDLVGHLLELTKSHAFERNNMEKKIRVLEMELIRRDKQVQGFSWFFNNRGIPLDPAQLASSDSAFQKSTSMEEVLKIQTLAGTAPAIVTALP